jgi:hypothetical protein
LYGSLTVIHSYIQSSYGPGLINLGGLAADALYVVGVFVVVLLGGTPVVIGIYMMKTDLQHWYAYLLTIGVALATVPTVLYILLYTGIVTGFVSAAIISGVGTAAVYGGYLLIARRYRTAWTRNMLVIVSNLLLVSMFLFSVATGYGVTDTFDVHKKITKNPPDRQFRIQGIEFEFMDLRCNAANNQLSFTLRGEGFNRARRIDFFVFNVSTAELVETKTGVNVSQSAISDTSDGKLWRDTVVLDNTSLENGQTYRITAEAPAGESATTICRTR